MDGLREREKGSEIKKKKFFEYIHFLCVTLIYSYLQPETPFQSSSSPVYPRRHPVAYAFWKQLSMSFTVT